jgi:hypothetical protein
MMKLKKIFIVLLLVLILAGLIIAYVVKNSTGDESDGYEAMQDVMSTGFSSDSSEGKSSKKKTTETTIKQNCEVKSALVEKVEPHASYYLEEICVEKNQYVEKGANILKYTNGTYLTAPYDCSITDINLPDVDGKLLNSHYVEISSNNVLSVTFNVDESNINKVNVGQEAKINITTLGKEYKGYVTNVASTASNGKFKITIEFENDGSVKLGMTASVQITI